MYFENNEENKDYIKTLRICLIVAMILDLFLISILIKKTIIKIFQFKNINYNSNERQTYCFVSLGLIYASLAALSMSFISILY